MDNKQNKETLYTIPNNYFIENPDKIISHIQLMEKKKKTNNTTILQILKPYIGLIIMMAFAFICMLIIIKFVPRIQNQKIIIVPTDDSTALHKQSQTIEIISDSLLTNKQDTGNQIPIK